MIELHELVIIFHDENLSLIVTLNENFSQCLVFLMLKVASRAKLAVEIVFLAKEISARLRFVVLGHVLDLFS